jgi:acetolactate synthase I/II/III large subunit
MRLADYVAERCAEAGARHVFLVTGGGAMHLNDALGRHKQLTPVCFHHEQAAAIAAESYYRINNQLCVLNVTTGPGGINALNGVFGAYVDSCGMLVISGQVKNETYLRNYDLPMRQLGDQEVDIVSMARPVVKYAVTLHDPKLIKEVMDKAIFLATHGRPGPVWVDIPVDIQSTQIDPDSLTGWDKNLTTLALDPAVTENTKLELHTLGIDQYERDIPAIIDRLYQAKRPVIYAGTGVRLSGMHDEFLELVERLGIPVVSSFNAYDVLTNDHPQYCGHPGMVGDRAGNFAVQNADFVLILGSRLNIRMISYNYKNFAKNAYKVMVDIDRAELDKPTLNIDLKVHCNLNNFIAEFLEQTTVYVRPETHTEYLNWCRERVAKYDPVLPTYKHTTDSLNPYLFFEDFFDKLDSTDIVVSGNGSASVISGQAGKLKAGQRFYSNSGNASMGYDVPAAIGASVAAGNKKVYCIAGDGSIMMNLQELQTIVGYQLPVKIIIVNNNGYHSIKQTQNAYFSDNVFGTSPEDGVTLPDFVALGTALGIMSHRVDTMNAWNSDMVQMLLKNNQPAIIEVVVDPDQMFAPKLAARKLEDGSMLAPSLEYMSPFLPDNEMEQNIIKDE